MRGVNKVIILGNLGKDPEVKYMPSGNAVASFSLATDESYTDKSTGQKIQKTEWHSIKMFGKLAEIAGQYIKKGSKVLVEGRLTPDKATGGPRIWTGQDGAPRASFEVTGNTVKFLSSRGEGGGGAGGTAPMHEPDAVMAEDSDDIPF